MNALTSSIPIRYFSDERACALLAEGRQGVSQIAYRLGYTDIANFSRSFKRINGISPSAFMAQILGKADCPELEAAPAAVPR